MWQRVALFSFGQLPGQYSRDRCIGRIVFNLWLLFAVDDDVYFVHLFVRTMLHSVCRVLNEFACSRKSSGWRLCSFEFSWIAAIVCAYLCWWVNVSSFIDVIRPVKNIEHARSLRIHSIKWNCIFHLVYAVRWPVFSCRFINDALYWYVYYRYFCFVLKNRLAPFVQCACLFLYSYEKSPLPRLHVQNSNGNNNNTEDRKWFFFRFSLSLFWNVDRRQAVLSDGFDNRFIFCVFVVRLYCLPPKPKNRFQFKRKKKILTSDIRRKRYKKSNFSERTTRDIVFQRWSIHTCLRRTVLGMLCVAKLWAAAAAAKKSFLSFVWIEIIPSFAMSHVQCVCAQSLVRSKNSTS